MVVQVVSGGGMSQSSSLCSITPTGIGCVARLHIPAGILRIPVFSVPNACAPLHSSTS